MTDLRKAHVLLTGAAGGLGEYIAVALAGEGASVTLSDLKGNRKTLDELKARIEQDGGSAAVLVADLSVSTERDTLIERVEDEVAAVDVLINNAAIEMTSAFTEFTDEELERMATINFLAPQILTRHALVGMSRRKSGHVVFMSSVAGRLGAAFNDPYAAAKAGLTGLSMSLRREYHGLPVEFSVVCPSFVSEAGMYWRMEQAQPVQAPVVISPQQCADGVIRAIRRNEPEVILAPRSRSPRPVLAIAALLPKLGERFAMAVGTDEVFRTMATAHKRIGALRPAVNVKPEPNTPAPKKPRAPRRAPAPSPA